MKFSSYRLGSQFVARSRFGLLKFSVTKSDWTAVQYKPSEDGGVKQGRLLWSTAASPAGEGVKLVNLEGGCQLHEHRALLFVSPTTGPPTPDPTEASSGASPSPFA